MSFNSKDDYISTVGTYLNNQGNTPLLEYKIVYPVDGFIFPCNTYKSIEEVAKALNLIESSKGLNRYGIVHQPIKIMDSRDKNYIMVQNIKPMFCGDYLTNLKTQISYVESKYDEISGIYNSKIKIGNVNLFVGRPFDELDYYKAIYELAITLQQVHKNAIEDSTAIALTLMTGTGVPLIPNPVSTAPLIAKAKAQVDSFLTPKITALQTNQYKL